MNITGQFEDIHHNLYTVTFSGDNIPTSMTIGDETSGLYFAADPVKIKADADDLKKPIIKTKCSITLLTRSYVGMLFFANDARSISVHITRRDNETRETTTVFRGFVTPVTYTQPYAKKYDTFTINCVDYLSTLKYYYYKSLTPSRYDDYVKQSGLISFKGILDDCFDETDMLIIYDNSKKLAQDSDLDIFENMYISEREMLDESADDLWTKEDVLTEMLQYLNLHIIQRGSTLYIFDWHTIKQMPVHNVDKDEYTSDGTTVSLEKIITQVQVEDDVNSVDDVVKSPLDDDYITSDYGNSQKYMCEYAADGEGTSAHDAFVELINERGTDYDAAMKKEWYLQIMRNPDWTLYAPDGTDIYTKIYNTYGNGINQWGAMKYAYENDFTPLLVSFGSREVKSVEQDTQSYYQKKPTMTNYMMISVNGEAYSKYNRDDYETSLDAKITDKLESIANGNGIAQFNNITTANINPTEDGTINYLVFEGKFILSPIVYRTASTKHEFYVGDNLYYTHDKYPIAYALDGNIDSMTGRACVAGGDNSDGRYYQMRFYDTEKYNDEPHANNTLLMAYPWIDQKHITESPQKLPYDGIEFIYQYSTRTDSDDITTNDYIWKIPVLACQLKVGDKYCCEGYEQDGDAKRSVYHWYTADEAEANDVDTMFYLGFDPAIDDFLLNKEWEISSNIDQIKANVDAWGTAIPIAHSDNLTGQVTFKILGVVNTTWEQITRRHPTFFRHTKWYHNSYPILDFVSNIFIKDFTCKIYSDNGGATITQDNDIVYVSAETEAYAANTDSTKFRFITQLTTDECITMGVKNTINVNSVTDGGAGYIRSIYNAKTDITAKAEEHFVNDYYEEYSTPKLLMSTDLKADNYMFSNTFSFETLGMTMFQTGYNVSLKNDTVNINLKQI